MADRHDLEGRIAHERLAVDQRLALRGPLILELDLRVAVIGIIRCLELVLAALRDPRAEPIAQRHASKPALHGPQRAHRSILAGRRGAR